MICAFFDCEDHQFKFHDPVLTEVCRFYGYRSESINPSPSCSRPFPFTLFFSFDFLYCFSFGGLSFPSPSARFALSWLAIGLKVIAETFQ